MSHDHSVLSTQGPTGGFDPQLGLGQFNVPQEKGDFRMTTQEDIRQGESVNHRAIPRQLDEEEGVTSGTPPPPTGTPTETQGQQFIEDVLRRYMGEFVAISVSFNNDRQEFRGDIVDVGTNFVIVEDTRLGSRAILPTLFVNYILAPIIPSTQ